MSTLPKFCPISTRQFTLMIVGLFVASLMFACGEEGGIGTDQDAELIIQPETVSFPNTPLGETRTETISFINDDGGTDIRLSEMELREDPFQAGSHEVFEVLDVEDDEIIVTTDHDENNPLEIQIAYTPEASEPYNARLHFDTNLASPTAIEIPIQATPPTPEMVAPSTIDFERVPPAGDDYRATVTAEIENIGFAELRMEDIYIAAGDNYYDVTFPVPMDRIDIDDDEWTDQERESLEHTQEQGGEFAGPDFDEDEVPEWLEEIAPGDTGVIRVGFRPETDEFQRGELHLKTNDPSAQPHYAINLIANSQAPCLEVVGGEVDFGPASMHGATQQAVTLHNCSGTTITEVFDIEVGDIENYNPDAPTQNFDADADIHFDIIESSLPPELRGEEVDGEPESELEPGESLHILMTYAPEAEEANEAWLKLESNDEASPLYVPVMGEGVDRECPVAVAQARNADGGAWTSMEVTGTPLDVIEFDASESYTPEDGELTYEWSLTDLPRGSNAQFNDPTATAPYLETDIAGIFTAELMAYDEFGIRSCEPAVVQLSILPDSDIHVELTWDVPASEDGTGVDLDLHYLHQAGTVWNQPSCDYCIYYGRNGQDEDAFGDGSDVFLDIDSLTGGEPENIYHSSPDPTYDYGIGVYYFADPINYGATDARVRIYLNNALMFDQVQRFITPGQGHPGEGDFWYVADVVVHPSHMELDEIDEFREDQGFPDQWE